MELFKEKSAFQNAWEGGILTPVSLHQVFKLCTFDDLYYRSICISIMSVYIHCLLQLNLKEWAANFYIGYKNEERN